MVAEEIITAIPPELIHELETLNIFVQALGGVLLLYILFNLVNMWINRRKKNHLRKISQNLEEIKKILKSMKKK